MACWLLDCLCLLLDLFGLLVVSLGGVCVLLVVFAILVWWFSGTSFGSWVLASWLLCLGVGYTCLVWF